MNLKLFLHVTELPFDVVFPGRVGCPELLLLLVGQSAPGCRRPSTELLFEQLADELLLVSALHTFHGLVRVVHGTHAQNLKPTTAHTARRRSIHAQQLKSRARMLELFLSAVLHLPGPSPGRTLPFPQSTV